VSTDFCRRLRTFITSSALSSPQEVEAEPVELAAVNLLKSCRRQWLAQTMKIEAAMRTADKSGSPA